MTEGPMTIVGYAHAHGVRLNGDQTRRLLALEAVLDVVRGRSVPIQVVERIAEWVNTGEAPQ